MYCEHQIASTKYLISNVSLTLEITFVSFKITQNKLPVLATNQECLTYKTELVILMIPKHFSVTDMFGLYKLSGFTVYTTVTLTHTALLFMNVDTYWQRI